MRIAIVDDIKEERDKLADVLMKQLSRRGIHVNLFEFENGEDFLIAAKERPFTVVFLDGDLSHLALVIRPDGNGLVVGADIEVVFGGIQHIPLRGFFL